MPPPVPFLEEVGRAVGVGWLGWRYNLFVEIGEGYVAVLVAGVCASGFSLTRCDPRATVRRELLVSLAWVIASGATLLVR